MPERTRKIWTLLLHRNSPLIPQIEKGILELLMTGKLAPGEKVPTMKEFAILNKVSHTTAEDAYSLLQQKFIFQKKGSKGSIISRKLAFQIPGLGGRDELKSNFEFRVHQKDNTLKLVSGLKNYIHIGNDMPNPTDVPATKFFKALTDMMLNKNDGLINNDFSTENLDYALMNLLFARGIPVSLQQFTLANQHVLAVVLGMLLQKGDKVASCFPLQHELNIMIKDTGAEMLYAGADEKGILINNLKNYCQQYHLKLLIIKSASAYPTTIKLDKQRGNELLEMANQYNFTILELNDDSEFVYKNGTLPLISRSPQGRVIYVSNLSKALPFLHVISLVVGPDDFIAALKQRYVNQPLLNIQSYKAILQYSLEKDIISIHARKVRAYYKDKWDFFALLVDHYLGSFCQFNRPAAGLAAWLELPKEALNPPLLIDFLERNQMYDLGGKSFCLLDEPIEALWIGLGAYNNKQLEALIKFLATQLRVNSK